MTIFFWLANAYILRKARIFATAGCETCFNRSKAQMSLPGVTYTAVKLYFGIF